ncbi:LysR family transcriptional regulator [Spongiactinospora sp. 9N601]|uniref:LysR family transcriptional regulator n=1 Tax=Spongiactinospora sp. 9N601 TaxID=3375149 RepID=UPI0037931F8A
MEELETRELAYFVAVARELSFSRAAERLGMAQPPLSRAIQRLERRLGVRLLERDSRGTTLTAAGDVLLREAGTVLEALSAAALRTRRAGRSEPRLVLAMKPGGDGGLLPAVLRAYAAEPGAYEVDVLFGFGERAAMLRDGRADAALVHLPRERLDGLAHVDLLVEPQVVVLPRGHRLAGRPTVRLADLDGEPQPTWPHLSGATGPPIQDLGQLVQLVTLGRMVAVVPASVSRHLGDELTCVPVVDAPPTTLALAWPEQSRSPALACFVRVAENVAENAVVDAVENAAECEKHRR